MESCKAVLLHMWTNSFGMTIQTKPFASTFKMLCSVFSILQNKIGKIVDFCFGGERVKVVN